jgi:hypothetical protein
VAKSRTAVDPRFGRFIDLERLAGEQAGIVSRAQALRVGLTPNSLAAAVAARRWQRVHDGVYAIFTGPLPESSRIWAGLAWAGQGAALARSTAMSQFGLTGSDDGLIHIVVDHSRRVGNTGDVRVSRRRDLERFVHPAKRPRSVRLEDAVLHEAASRDRLSDGLGLIADACQGRRTTEGRLRVALADFPSLRNRRIWSAVLDDVAIGTHSFLEISYLRRVERGHRLPTPDRQHAARSLGRRVWRDGDYPQWGISLELDGRLGHEWSTDRRRDRRRDLVLAGSGGLTLRHGYADVFEDACETAALVVRVLWARGWQGQPRACGHDCRLWDCLRLLASA